MITEASSWLLMKHARKMGRISHNGYFFLSSFLSERRLISPLSLTRAATTHHDTSYSST